MQMDAKQAPPLMTVKELAAEWRQHPATVYRKIAAGEVPAIRLGGSTSALRIPRAELEARLHEFPAERRVPEGGVVDGVAAAGTRDL